MGVNPEDITTQVVRWDNAYSVTAADGTVIPLPRKKGVKIKMPAKVSVTLPQAGADWYYVVILPNEYSGFIDKWTDKVVNSDFLLKLASQSLPRSLGFIVLAGPGAIVGAVLGTLFTPSDISKETQIDRTLDDGQRVVYMVMTGFKVNPNSP